MPYRRMYRPRYKKRRFTKRKRGGYRALKPNRYKRPRNQITRASFRNWEVTTLDNVNLGGVGVDNPQHFARALSDMQGCSPYISLFSQYRVRKLKFQFIPTTGSKAVTDSTKAATAVQPLLASAVNRVATSFPQNMESVFSMGSVKWSKAGSYHERYYKPVTYDQVYRDLPNATNALNPEYDQWISTNMANVNQHGLSLVLGGAGDLPSGYYKYRIITTMYVEFKNRRVNTDNASITTLVQTTANNV